ncbi:MAG TPA: hypothetical protein VM141_08240 [Planctomycetota bacterium]|nr:hypothetical protein [Planctomycetota bacterium]
MTENQESYRAGGENQKLTLRPDLQFSVLCDDVRQELNGKLILIGLFEAIRVKMFPVRHAMLFIVNRWRNGEGSFTECTKIVSATNHKVVEGPKALFTLPGTHASHTVIHRFPNVPFEAAGTYWVEIELDGELIHRYPISLVENDKE